MSMFDHVSVFKVSEELRLFIALKYGNPVDVDLLPETVVVEAYRSVVSDNYRRIFTGEEDLQRSTLGIMLRQSANKEKTQRAILLHLLQYHTLNP